VTRLVEDDVRGLMEELDGFDARLRGVAGIGLAECARRAWDQPADQPVLEGVRMAAVPISQGEGFIPAFSQCTAAILRFLGADAFVTELPDVRGLQQAADAGAELVFVADDSRFVALNIHSGACADDDPCTARAYVAALEAAAGGLGRRDVGLLGYGLVGRHAAARLAERGARVLAVEPDPARGAAAAEEGHRVLALDDALAAVDLLFDATPADDVVGAGWVTPASIAAVPGMPSALTPEAQLLLGERHIHEPLALGVAAMAVDALRR
jgi:3-methylornithyl-N6-L-lysine dehydrogenase